MSELSVVGKSFIRRDAVDKVIGNAKFSMDLRLSHALRGKVKRSKLPHAKLLDIDTSRAERLSGVKAIVTADDTPNIRFGRFVRDETLLAYEKVRFIGEPVAAVAAIDEDTVEEAIELIKVDYGELSPVYSPERAMSEGASTVHDDLETYSNISKVSYGNVCSYTMIENGDVDLGFSKADFVFEDTFKTQVVHQCYMEPWSAMVDVDASGNIAIWTATNIPFHVRAQLSEALRIPMNKIRLHSVHAGGSFGGKLTTVPGICLLLARKAGKPVRLELTRQEDFIAAAPRHPSIIDMKTGVMKDGTLVARKIKIVLDTGAYALYGPSALGVAASFSSGPYKIPHVRVDGYCVYSNKVPGGAFRGYGNPQEKFAGESQIDIIADRLGIDPVEIRLKNLLREGEELPFGQRLFRIGLEEALKKISPDSVTNKHVQADKGTLKTGRGIACMIRGNGLISSGAVVKANEDGTFTLLTGARDVGQGSDTLLSQIVAEELGVGLEDISIVSADTESTPFDFGAMASSNTHTSGGAVKLAAEEVREQLLELAAEQLNVNKADLELNHCRVSVKKSPETNISLPALSAVAIHKKGGPIMGQGSFREVGSPIVPERVQGFQFMNGFPSFMAAAQMAEVEVDTETGQVRVRRIVALNDAGRLINPMAAEGQVEGGIAQGVGYALTEETVFDGGLVLNPSFTDYKIPTVLDVPGIKPVFVEEPDDTGPLGAKGFSEGCLVPVAPAIANAIYNAVGVRIRELPITAEKVLKELKTNTVGDVEW